MKFQDIHFGRLMGSIHNTRATGKNNAGALTKLLGYLNENLSQENYVGIDDMKEEIINILNSFYNKGNEIFDRIMYPFAQELSNAEIKERIDRPKIKNTKFWKEIVDKNIELKEIYGELIRKINKFLNNIEDFDLEDEDGIIFDFTKYYSRLKDYYKNFEFYYRVK